MTRSFWKVAKVVLGIILIVFGFVALLLPLVPFAWVALIGLELVGIRLTFWEKIKKWLRKREKEDRS